MAAKTATSSVHARCTTWVAMSQPAAGVGVRQPGVVERRDQVVEGGALLGEIPEHLVEKVAHPGPRGIESLASAASRWRDFGAS